MTTFAEAVRQTPPPVDGAYRPGKQALRGEHRDLVDCDDPRRFTGSINLEEALAQSTMALGNPWDYGVGFRERSGQETAIWIEVHPAYTSEVSAVLRKLQWLRAWLEKEAPALNVLSSGRPDGHFFWLSTATGVHITPGSPQARRLRQAGLPMPQRRLRLP